jgi:hypothetical protein
LIQARAARCSRAGLLGFIVGLVIVSQNFYARRWRNLEEFATLKGHRRVGAA